MAFSEQTASIDQRLSKQLHGFSELSEVLTLRVLDLEERLKVLEKSRDLHESPFEETSKSLLAESEERFRHLTALLEESGEKESALHVLPDNSVEKKELVPNVKCDDIDSSMRGIEVDLAENDLTEDELDNEDLDSSEVMDTQYLDDPQMPLLSA